MKRLACFGLVLACCWIASMVVMPTAESCPNCGVTCGDDLAISYGYYTGGTLWIAWDIDMECGGYDASPCDFCARIQLWKADSNGVYQSVMITWATNDSQGWICPTTWSQWSKSITYLPIAPGNYQYSVEIWPMDVTPAQEYRRNGGTPCAIETKTFTKLGTDPLRHE